MDNMEIVQRVATVEEKVRTHDMQIDDLKKETKGIPRLDELLKMAIETNKEQSKTFKEHSETLRMINENLSGLNGEMKNLSSQVSTLGGRVEKLEENEDDKKIDIAKLIKQILWVGVPALIVAAVVFYAGWK